jgi:hypothetical protein
LTDLPTCLRCPRPIPDTAYIETRCASDLRAQLERVATLAGEAAATVAKLDRLSAGGRRTDTEAPLPLKLAAAADHDAAVSTLLTWARHIHEQSGRELPTVRTAPCPHASCAQRRAGRIQGPRCEGQAPEHPVAVLAAWLVGQVDWLRYRPEADEAFDEITYACRLAERVVDRQPERWYAGPCGADGCEAELYPPAGAKVIRCPDCGTEHDAQDRRDWLLDEAEDQLAGASWIAATLTSLGRTVRADTVRQWAERERLIPHGHDANGRPLYRLSEVRELVDEAEARALDRERKAIIREQRKAAKELAAAEDETMAIEGAA